MTNQSESTRIREWFLGAVIVFGFAGDIASRYWGTTADSHVTAGQVSNLTTQMQSLSGSVKELSDKVGNMPRTSDVTALGGRVDGQARDIGALQQGQAALRADVDNLMHPTNFRNPR